LEKKKEDERKKGKKVKKRHEIRETHDSYRRSVGTKSKTTNYTQDHHHETDTKRSTIALSVFYIAIGLDYFRKRLLGSFIVSKRNAQALRRCAPWRTRG